jgi:glycosyltransferase involved in cell wall biosynthesis
MEYSVIVPLYNEAGNVRPLHKKIIGALSRLTEDFEVIFVDDCSSDSTVAESADLKPIMLITLRKNRGQTAALDAGIKHARGKYIITMDGDLQNDPADIPRLVEHLEKNEYDLVCGWRKNRYDPLMKRIVSRGANFIRGFMIKDNIHDSGCALKVIKRECFETLDLYGEMHRFIPALLKIRGYRIGEREVTHHPRIHGKTKYNWRRTFKGLLDIFSVWFWEKYMNRPMHLIGGVGLVFFVLGSAASLYVVYMKLIYHIDLSDNAMTTAAFFFFFFGLNYLLFGILFDVSSKIYFNDSKDKSYFVKDVVVNKNSSG